MGKDRASVEWLDCGGADAAAQGKSLAHAWFRLQDLPERGASGRLIVAPCALTRNDLDYNWEIIGTAILHHGTRTGVDVFQEEVELFFDLSRPRGKKPVTSILDRTMQLAWLIASSCVRLVFSLEHF